MERLTWFEDASAARRMNCRNCPTAGKCKDLFDCKDTVVNRLAAIEDILGDTYDLDRLRELITADKDGRCVVLPCKDWLDLVFGEQEVFWAVDDDYDDKKIREITVRNEERFIWFDGWETVVFNGTDENGLDYEFYPEDVGKTVFLNREAAEAAIAEKEGKS